jgi:hypothetical protein
MIQKMNQSAGNAAGYKISGTVTKADYDSMVPDVETLVKQNGTVNLLLEMTEFKWEKVSAWGADMQFGRDYRKKIEKMAIVGDKKWQDWLTKVAEPFYAVEAKFFSSDDIDDAWAWVT